MVWGIEHFHLYLYGSSFQVITDHKPLEMIFNNPTCKATARLGRLQLRLQPYKTKIIYKPGADNPADYMSRHPDPKQSQNPSHLSRVDAYINFVTTNAVPPAVTLQEVKDATAADETLQSLARVITGNLSTRRFWGGGDVYKRASLGKRAPSFPAKSKLKQIGIFATATLSKPASKA